MKEIEALQNGAGLIVTGCCDIIVLPDDRNSGSCNLKSGEITEEELQQSKNEQTEMMQKDIEFLRLKKEYHDLQIAIITNDVLLGNRPISSVPGLLGAELSVREIKSQTIMSQFVHEMNIRMEEEAKKKKEQDDKQQEVSAQEN